MDPANAVLDTATTTAQEERSLAAFQNLSLASPSIYPIQSSDSEMVGPAVKEPTSVEEFWVADRPSLWPKLLEAISKLDKLEADMNMKRNLECVQSLLPPSDSTMLACLVDKFLHKFTPPESGQRKAWVQSKINKLSQASKISMANIVEFMIVHASRVERGMLYSFPSNSSVARAITRVTDDYERSIFKALFLLELNHTIEDELEDGYTFVTDVVGCIRTGRQERLDNLRLCS